MSGRCDPRGFREDGEMYQLVRRRQTDPALEFLTSPPHGLKNLGFMRVFCESHLPLLGVIRWLSIGNLPLIFTTLSCALKFFRAEFVVFTDLWNIVPYFIFVLSAPAETSTTHIEMR